MSQINCHRNKRPEDDLVQCDGCEKWIELEEMEMLTSADGLMKQFCPACIDQFDRDNQF